jgi:hypothetical protein
MSSSGPVYRVPVGGIPAWVGTDATEAPAARLDQGLEVIVTERWGDWANIRCSNGWTAWVDGRALEPLGVAGSSADPTGPSGLSGQLGLSGQSGRAGSPTRSGRGGPRPGRPTASFLGWSKQVVVAGRTIEVGVPVVGAGVALVGSMLDWVSVPGVSASSFDVKLNFLTSPKSTPSGPDLGIVLLVLVVGFGWSVVTDRRPRERRWCGGAVAAVAVTYALQMNSWLSQFPADQRPGWIETLGLGVWATLVGGILMSLPSTRQGLP